MFGIWPKRDLEFFFFFSFIFRQNVMSQSQENSFDNHMYFPLLTYCGWKLKPSHEGWNFAPDPGSPWRILHTTFVWHPQSRRDNDTRTRTNTHQSQKSTLAVRVYTCHFLFFGEKQSFYSPVWSWMWLRGRVSTVLITGMAVLEDQLFNFFFPLLFSQWFCSDLIWK